MTKRFLFWFAYAAYASAEASAADRSDPVRPFKMRDAAAAGLLMQALALRGYEHADTFLNYPLVKGRAPAAVNLGQFQPGDLILLTTRPPLHDQEIGNRRSILRSYTNLEKLIFAALCEHFFVTCARSEIVLRPSIAAISPAIAARTSIEPHQHGGASYQRISNPATGDRVIYKDMEPRTAAYLVYLEEAWKNGPGLLAAFGVGGTETFIWGRQLETRYRDLLCERSFVMAEMPAAPRSLRPSSLRFADEWETEILGEAPVPWRPDRRAG